MSNYQQQQQQHPSQPRPYYPGQAPPPQQQQQGPPVQQGFQGQYAPVSKDGPPGTQQQHYQQQQTPPGIRPGGPYGNVRPAGVGGPGPIPGNSPIRPGPGPVGVRPNAPGHGTQQPRPPLNGSQPLPHPQQQQQQQQQHPGGRPPSNTIPPGARPSSGIRPLNQPMQIISPPTGHQAGMATAAHHHPQPGPAHGHVQTPTSISTPGTAVQPLPSSQSPMKGHQHHPANVTQGHNQPYQQQTHPQQQAPYQQQTQQYQNQPAPPPPPAAPTTAAAHQTNGLHKQMSNMSMGSSGSMDQQGHPPQMPSQMPPQGPPMQSETKPKAGARAKRVFATDPSAPPPLQEQAGVIPPPIPHPGITNAPEPYGARPYEQQAHHGQGQHPGHAHQQHHQHHHQQQQQQHPSGAQQPHLAHHQQHHTTPQQPMGQSQQFRPQVPHQPVSRSKIDPDAIPSPVAVQEADQQECDKSSFVTTVRTITHTPLASSDFMAIDGGNCNPRFFRMTTYHIPNCDELANSSHLPMGLVIQPLAQLRADEAPIETVDFGDAGPARCRRCNTYINPYMVFTNGGQRFVCNMCLFENEVEPGYFCNLDMNGRRCDLDQRPELRNGTIEFAVPKAYWGKTPASAAYVFAIDVSWSSVQSGMLQQCVTGIKKAIWDANGVSRLAPGVQIGIMTYDKNVHFYNLSPTLEQAQMMVVPDVNDMFVPLSDGFLVNPENSQTLVESMLDMLPQIFAENKTTEQVLGAVVQAVKMALENRGGKLVLFQTALPTFGPGALRHREDSKLYGTDKEKTLFAPQDDFYKKLAEKCVDAALSIDMFLFPNTNIDVATLGCLTSITGGETHMFPNFNAVRDGAKLAGDISRLVARPFGFNALMRVRCSTGLRVADHFGNFHMKNNTDLEIAGLDSEKAFGVLIKHEGKLDEKTEASFQVALLYTTADGRRRVRVHNFSTPITTSLGDVFRWSDMDTTLNFLSKGAVSQALSRPMTEVREHLTEKCVKVLASYRRHCASSTSAGQLILPEALKLFPLYTLALLKSKIMRAGLNSDQRVHSMRMLKSMGISESIAYFYPRMMVVHSMDEMVGVLDINGRVMLPPLVRVSYLRLLPGGAYLLENGQKLFFWLGREISAQFLQDVFGVGSLGEVDPTMHYLPELSNATSSQIRTLQTYLQGQRGSYLDLIVTRQGMDRSEQEFADLLIEDKNNDAMSYVDYLPTIHRMIQTEVSTKPHEVHTSIWSN